MTSRCVLKDLGVVIFWIFQLKIDKKGLIFPKNKFCEVNVEVALISFQGGLGEI